MVKTDKNNYISFPFHQYYDDVNIFIIFLITFTINITNYYLSRKLIALENHKEKFSKLN